MCGLGQFEKRAHSDQTAWREGDTWKT